MLKVIERYFALICAIIFLLSFMSACTPSSDGQNGGNSSDISKPIAEYFKKEVKYDSYTPAEDVALPVSGTEAIDHTQIRKKLYILASDGVYTFDTELGEGQKLFEISADSITAYGEDLFLFNTKTGELFEYSSSGELISSAIVDGLSGWNLFDFETTENYFVIDRYKYATEGSPAQMQIVTVRRDSYTVETEKDIKDGYYNTCYYKDDKIFAVYQETGGEVNSDGLYVFDAKSGKMEKIRGLNIGQGYINCIDICYNPNAETVLLALALENIALWEFSVDSEENTLLDKFSGLYQGTVNWDVASISVFENAVSIIGDVDSKYRSFDYLAPREYISIAFVDAYGGSIQSGELQKMAASYELEHDILVRLTVYDSVQLLNMKLLAGDEDMDLYSTYMGPDCKDIINNHSYINLGSFDGLGAKMSSNAFVDRLSQAGDEYFGLPYAIMDYFPKRHTKPDSMNAIDQYCIKYFNVETDEYSDADGSELLKVLKHHFENPNGSDNQFYDIPFGTVQVDYLVMNPASKKQSVSADFLEYVFDTMNTDEAILLADFGNANVYSSYIPIDNADTLYPTWQLRSNAALETIYKAYREVLKTDGSNSELKKLAKEAARSFMMRLNG